MITLLDTVIDERTTPAGLDRIRRNHADAIREMQQTSGISARKIKDVVLVDGVPTPIPHGLGRPAFVTHTPPRGAAAAGRIDEIRDGSHDRNQYVVLRAIGYGGPITVDVKVEPL